MNLLPDLTFVIFIFAWFLSFFVPGDVLIKSLKLDTAKRLVLATTLGIVLWALQGVLFGYLGVRFLTYFYIIFFFFLWLKFSMFKVDFKFKKINLLILIIVISGTIMNLSAVWAMGIKKGDGSLVFCCRGVPDAIYHLSLTNQIEKNFPPNEPGSYGDKVENYHLLSNLVAADISRVFKLDIAPVQFRYVSMVGVILLGGSAFVFSSLLKLRDSYGKWLALFLYLSGDILYILLFLRTGKLNFTVTIIDDATKLLAGPPRALSIFLLMGGLCFMVIWLKKRDLFSGLITAVIIGSLVGFKVYTGIFALIGMGFMGSYFLIKKDIKMIIPLIFAGLLSLILYLTVIGTAGHLSFNGLWRFEDFIVHKDLGLQRLELARLIFLNDYKYLQVALFEMFFIAVYFAFLFGTTNLALMQTRSSLKLFPQELNIFLISGLVTTLGMGLFFIQNPGGANTIQFIMGGFLIAGIYAALACYWLTTKLKTYTKYFVVSIIVAFTISRGLFEVIGNIRSISHAEGLKIDANEIEALNYINTSIDKDSVIMLSEWMSEEEIFLYISFLGDRPVFLTGAGVLRDHGFDTTGKKAVVSQVLNSDDLELVRVLVSENKINYLYLPQEVNFKLLGNDSVSEIKFQNQKIKIIKFN